MMSAKIALLHKFNAEDFLLAMLRFLIFYLFIYLFSAHLLLRAEEHKKFCSEDIKDLPMGCALGLMDCLRAKSKSWRLQVCWW